MALLELEDVFPHIHFTTLQELYNDCGGNTSQVANFLTEDTAINLSDDVCSPVLNFNTRCDDLPSSNTYEVDSLSALLSPHQYIVSGGGHSGVHTVSIRTPPRTIVTAYIAGTPCKEYLVCEASSSIKYLYSPQQ